MKNRMLLVFLATVVAVSLAVFGGCCPAAPVEEYPTHPVQLINPYSPGGGIDMNSRAVVAVAADYLGQPMIAVCKPGAAGAVGAEYVAKQPADGYTVLITAPDAFYRGLVEPLPFSMETFTAVGMISNDPEIQYVNVDSPYQTLADLIKDAKARPGQVKASVVGMFGMEHLIFEFIALQENIKWNHIVEKGGGPALASVLGGHTDCSSGLPPVVGPQIEAGLVRGLSVSHDERLGYDPFKELPTLKELGYDFTMHMWVPILVHKETPAPIVKKLESAVAQIVEDKSFTKLMGKMGVTIVYKNAADTMEFLRKDIAAVDKVVKAIKK